MNSIHTYGIVTNDFELARDTLEFIIGDRTDVRYKSISMTHTGVVFESGERWSWIRPSDNCRCFRLHKVYFGKDVTYEMYDRVMAMLCSGYCDEINWI